MEEPIVKRGKKCEIPREHTMNVIRIQMIVKNR
jgi:hypothetical protein